MKPCEPPEHQFYLTWPGGGKGQKCVCGEKEYPWERPDLKLSGAH
jgi:hypothetical protein